MLQWSTRALKDHFGCVWRWSLYQGSTLQRISAWQAASVWNLFSPCHFQHICSEERISPWPILHFYWNFILCTAVLFTCLNDHFSLMLHTYAWFEMFHVHSSIRSMSILWKLKGMWNISIPVRVWLLLASRSHVSITLIEYSHHALIWKEKCWQST